jgi:hypothetical protein
MSRRDASPVWDIGQVPQMGQGRQVIGGFLYSEKDVKRSVNKKGYSYDLTGLGFHVTQFTA